MINISKEQSIERSNRIKCAVDIIDSTLSLYGYTELNLPIYEYYDLLQDTVFNFSDESIIRFIDRHTGKTLVLRPDFTPQVCRIVAGFENLPLPFRASYKGAVFRSVEKDRGIKSEENQAGWEIFGEKTLYGDMEIMLTANNVLENLNLKGYIFSFGDTIFLNRVKELLGNSGDYILKAVTERRIHDLKKHIENISISEDLKNLLIKLPLSFGGKEVIKELLKLTEFDEELSFRLDFIEKLFYQLIEKGIDEDKLVFDAGESKGLDYYTGIHFEILHTSYGNVLGSGGRYDNLMAKFGKDYTACGVALNIDNLLNFPICNCTENQYDYLILGENNFKKAIELRKKGNKVIFVADESQKDSFIKNYKFKNII